MTFSYKGGFSMTFKKVVAILAIIFIVSFVGACSQP